MLGKGEAEPIESNKTAKGRKLNQRVDIVVRLKRVLATP
jgi:flagellar motor protein MotB